MDADLIEDKMRKYLRISGNVLADWLGKVLPLVSENWWNECVIGNLSYNQQKIALENGYTKIGQFDPAALLRIADKSWYSLLNVEFLTKSDRECIREMMRVRNNWAHAGVILPGKDVILADLNTFHAFFKQWGCEESLLNEIDQMIEEVKSPSTVDFSALSQKSPTDTPAETVPKAVDNNEIAINSLVYLVANPDVKGVVMSITDLGDTMKYGVFVDNTVKTFYSGQIALGDQETAEKSVDLNTFRSYLTAYQINNPSGNNLYSLNSARIDFVPYQFRPALKLIHADEPKILIADSVGVGKTIEAGLIIKELQARHELENVLIICPKPLVTERKWELEMKRFDEEFIPVNGPTLRQIISDTHRDGEWPIRYSKIIVPYSILDGRTYLNNSSKKKGTFGLLDLDPVPHFDLVIIDEAHHIRNGNMAKVKAFDYKCVKYFCDNADAVVMLTATPLQTSNDDMFTLLNILRPDVVIDKQTFRMMSGPNVYISEAVRAMRRADENWHEKALESLKGVLETQWGEDVIATNPVYGKIVKTLHQEKITQEERVKLISDTESLHSFNSMMNRTRRKDIQDFCIRKPFTLAVEFTERQRILHDELLRFEENALLQIHGNSKSISFMMSTIMRQAASCIFGLAPHIRYLIEKRFKQIDDDPDLDYSLEFELNEADADTLTGMAKNLLEMADNLPEEDPKFDQMLEKIMEKQKQDNNKIILFSTFRYTLTYLEKKLRNAGLRVAQVTGSVKDDMRQELRERFELPKDNKNAIDILLFTEVGSEGLDYQFCNMIINYDLPWNPMKIEQRIGRIDRRGQKSETVSIYNVITKDTVDADIYYRCLERIGIFNGSVGECEEILGDIATKLENIAMDLLLTKEERRIKLQQMADNEIRRLQELNRLEEEEKELFGIDLSEHMTSQEIHNAENPWLKEKNLQNMIEEYLYRRLGKREYIIGGGDLKQIRLDKDARKALREDFRKLPAGRNIVRQEWDNYLKGTEPLHPITFNSEFAEKRRDAFLITAMHPLAKQAAAHFASHELAYIRLQYVSDYLPAGKYHFSVYAWYYAGMNPHSKLVVVCDNDLIAEELPEILNVTQSGATTVNLSTSEWDDLEKKQVKLLMEEKKAEDEDAENILKYNTECLYNNFLNQKRSLEQRMRDADNESIRVMYVSLLEKATLKYELKSEDLRKKRNQTDILSTLIANGILDVVN